MQVKTEEAMRHLACLAVLLFGGSALQASVFSFSYSGTELVSGTHVSASGTLTATATTGGLYQVTGITGTRVVGSTDETITGGSSLGLLYSSGSGLGLDPGSAGILTFGLSGITGTDTLEYISGLGYEETLLAGLSSSTANLTSFTITAMPEPATLLLFLSAGLGVWVLARKLPSRKTL
jgi:hypothetical protein